jgi:phosphatidylserine decarboxylase
MEKHNIKKESAGLRFLYHTVIGRLFLKALTARWVSKAAGAFMDSPLSKPLIKSFVNKNGINLDDFYSDDFKCFNDCFTRKIKEGKRTLDMDKNAFIAPCDALLSAYKIDESTRLDIKGCVYTVDELLENKELGAKYKGGIALVFRLCVNHYHRYIYLDKCTKGENVFIKGKLHTVRPIALESAPVFKQNCREYTVMHTENFGDVVQLEVGALLVGKIANHHGAGTFERGQEKGTFLYGGSTIVVLLEKDAADIDESYFVATENGEETDVVMGQRLGTKRNKNV